MSEREAEILHFMLGADDARLAPLHVQARLAFVTGRCSCGCATVDIAVDRERTRPVTAGFVALIDVAMVFILPVAATLNTCDIVRT